MSDNNYTPLIDNENKNTSYKKYGAALGVTGITVAAALLLAGRSNVTEQEPASLLEMPKINELSARMPIDEPTSEEWHRHHRHQHHRESEPLTEGMTNLWGYPLEEVETTCNGNFDRIA